MKFPTVCLTAVTLLSFYTTGCSRTPDDQPALGLVAGRVVFDGLPVEKLQITFIPEEGRPSNGVTDELGIYELVYVGSEKGAKIGHHSVRISTLDVGEEGRPTEEVIPTKYNVNTVLTADVTSGPNEIDFAITSE